MTLHPEPGQEHARRAEARARLAHHEARELRALQLAVDSPDDAIARLLEARALRAYLDAEAIATEHDITPTIHDIA